MNIAVPSALMRSPHDRHGVFDVAPLSGFFGVALVLASLGILGRLGDCLEAVLLEHLTRDHVNLYLRYHVALLMFHHAGKPQRPMPVCGPIQVPLNRKSRSIWLTQLNFTPLHQKRGEQFARFSSVSGGPTPLLPGYSRNTRTTGNTFWSL